MSPYVVYICPLTFFHSSIEAGLTYPSPENMPPSHLWCLGALKLHVVPWFCVCHLERYFLWVKNLLVHWICLWLFVMHMHIQIYAHTCICCFLLYLLIFSFDVYTYVKLIASILKRNRNYKKIICWFLLLLGLGGRLYMSLGWTESFGIKVWKEFLCLFWPSQIWIYGV